MMIVVAIMGVLSAVALPRFLSARAVAEAGASVGELIGVAKVCATANASKIAFFLSQPSDSALITCNGTATNQISGRRFPANALGVRCLLSNTTANSVRPVINISPTGTMTCTFITT